MALDATAALATAGRVINAVNALPADATPLERWNAAIRQIFIGISLYGEVRVTIQTTDVGLQSYTIAPAPAVETTGPFFPKSVRGVIE